MQLNESEELDVFRLAAVLVGLREPRHVAVLGHHGRISLPAVSFAKLDGLVLELGKCHGHDLWETLGTPFRQRQTAETIGQLVELVIHRTLGHG